MRTAFGVFGAGVLVVLSCTAQEAQEAREADPAARVAELEARLHIRRNVDNLRGGRPSARVVLPSRANGEVELEDVASGASVRFALEGADDAPVAKDGATALYVRALAGADLVQRVDAEGTEDFVAFEKRPARAELRYRVDVTRVAGLRLVDGTLEFLDSGGAPRLRVLRPYVVDARASRHDGELAVERCAYDTNAAPPWGRQLVGPGNDHCVLRVGWPGDIPYPAVVDPTWVTTSAMKAARYDHTATLLPSGVVLLSGGFSQAGALASAELYDPTTRTFAATGSMTARYAHSANVLGTGKVLVAGGYGSGGAQSSAELYDPATGLFAATGALGTARADHTASVLGSGKVLVSGGRGAGATTTHASAELYDPATALFAPTGAMPKSRYAHTATVLLSGKVLLTGGRGDSAPTSTELYDPAAGTFAPTGPLGTGRTDHTATRLPSGKVLVAGGTGPGALADAELYDPAAGVFSPTGALKQARGNHGAAALPSGMVLVVAGQISGSAPLASTELYDPAAGATTAAAPLATARANHTVTVLPSGQLLVTGGSCGTCATGALASAELYGVAEGETCSASSECLSGFCVDGVCCNAACERPCERCDVAPKGTCKSAPAGPPRATASCAAYACDGVSATCATACASDAACAPGHYCAPDSTCQPRKPQASPCDPLASCKEPNCRQCGSGFCVDGFCCDSECRGACQACAAAVKHSGATDGTCGPTKDGTDPRDDCARSGGACGPDGLCNGTGACRRFAPAGVSCAEGKTCDGAGECVFPRADVCDGDHIVRKLDGTTEDCAPYKCQSNGTCRLDCNSVNDCVAPMICDSAGTCAPLPPEAPPEGRCSISRGVGRDGPGHVTSSLALALLAIALRRTRRPRTL